MCDYCRLLWVNIHTCMNSKSILGTYVNAYLNHSKIMNVNSISISKQIWILCYAWDRWMFSGGNESIAHGIVVKLLWQVNLLACYWLEVSYSLDINTNITIANTHDQAAGWKPRTQMKDGWSKKLSSLNLSQRSR